MDSIKFAISFVVFGYFIFSTSYLISLAVPVQRRYFSYLVMTVIGGGMAYTLGGLECASGALCGALGPLMFLAGMRQKLRSSRRANSGSERADLRPPVYSEAPLLTAEQVAGYSRYANGDLSNDNDNALFGGEGSK